MTKKERFIAAYKEFENAVAGSDWADGTVPGYEEKVREVDDRRMRKIRICRHLRNYIQHQDPDFVEVTENMTAFLKKETKAAKESGLSAADLMKRQKPLRPSDRICDAAVKLGKTPGLVVTDDEGIPIGFFTDAAVRRAVVKGRLDGSIEENKDLLSRLPHAVRKEAPVRHLLPGIYIVTETGYGNSKYVGILER